jgi:hypothetical protein
VDFTKVNRTDLLEKLKENRDKHKKEYLSARKKWRKKATKALKKAYEKAEESKGEQIDEYPLSGLPKPTHYLKSYDVMIARLTAEVEPTVELSDRDFQAYWMDEWTWTQQFVAATSLYNSPH